MRRRRLPRGALGHLAAIAALVVIAAAVTAYVLDHQRTRWPWERVMTIEAELSSAQAVTPGQGQAVTIAGVSVGEVASVRLERGRAVVDLALDPDAAGPVYRDATLLLRPRTALNDMTVQLEPGAPDPSLPGSGRLADGDRLPVSSTSPNVNPDELLGALDADVRRYLTVLVNAAGGGLRGRGRDLRAVFRASRPTLEQLARVDRALAGRRRELRRLVTRMRRFTAATAARGDDLTELTAAASDLFATSGRREVELDRALASLPGAVAATRGALGEGSALARELRPTLIALRPAARELEPALRALRRPLALLPPALRAQVRPLARDAVPVLEELQPSLPHLNRAVPQLERSGHVLEHVANEIAFNPPGPEEGYLFWTSWFFHNLNSIFSVEDAHGSVWRGLLLFGCQSTAETLAANELVGALGRSPVCPGADATAPVPSERRSRR